MGPFWLIVYTPGKSFYRPSLVLTARMFFCSQFGMARNAFYSFHFGPDNWRAAQVRNMGFIEGNSPASDNAWEAIKRGGDPAIQRWIDGQMSGRSCAIVLIGSNTAGRKWINYEIKKAWSDRKGVLGIYIHGLKDRSGVQTYKGQNPFTGFSVGNQALANIAISYDPPFSESTQVYKYISDNLASWVEVAIGIRGRY